MRRSLQNLRASSSLLVIHIVGDGSSATIQQRRANIVSVFDDWAEHRTVIWRIALFAKSSMSCFTHGEVALLHLPGIALTGTV
jgi:hypothetical protein